MVLCLCVFFFSSVMRLILSCWLPVCLLSCMLWIKRGYLSNIEISSTNINIHLYILWYIHIEHELEHFYLSNCMFNVKPARQSKKKKKKTMPIQTTIRNHFPFIWIISNKIHILFSLFFSPRLPLVIILLLILLLQKHLHPTSIYSLSYSGELFFLQRMGSMPSYSFFFLSFFCSAGYIHYYYHCCYRM